MDQIVVHPPILPRFIKLDEEPNLEAGQEIPRRNSSENALRSISLHEQRCVVVILVLAFEVFLWLGKSDVVIPPQERAGAAIIIAIVGLDALVLIRILKRHSGNSLDG
jgi:hypothetical protein